MLVFSQYVVKSVGVLDLIDIHLFLPIFVILPPGDIECVSGDVTHQWPCIISHSYRAKLKRY